MKKATLYSSSARTKARAPEPPASPPAAEPPGPPSWRARLAAGLRRQERLLLVATSVLLTLALLATYARLHPGPRELTQKDIDNAVVHTLENLPPASPAAKAYDAVIASVVRVVGTGDERDDGKPPDRGIGTGVVIIDSGIILTNLHVVSDAKRIRVTFVDGSNPMPTWCRSSRRTTSP